MAFKSRLEEKWMALTAMKQAADGEPTQDMDPGEAKVRGLIDRMLDRATGEDRP